MAGTRDSIIEMRTIVARQRMASLLAEADDERLAAGSRSRPSRQLRLLRLLGGWLAAAAVRPEWPRLSSAGHHG